MKTGIIDIGTNSVRLFVPDETRLVNSQKFLRITRIGEQVNQNRFLLERAMTRTVKGLGELKVIAESLGVERLVALATSAVRDAQNREVFIERVQEELGIHVTVLSGAEEAYLGYLGTVRGLESQRGQMLIIDIGGGSTELIDGSSSGIDKSHSFDIGVVRLTELFDLSDPPEPTELTDMGAYVAKTLEDFLEDCRGSLVGIGGTITTLAAIHLAMDTYDRQKIHGAEITRKDIEGIFDRLKAMDNEERKEVVGLDEKRADVILAGIVIVLEIMKATKRESIVVSDFDNLEGYYFNKISC